MKKSFLFISCDEAKQICDKSQYGEATIWERFKLSIRLMYCRITKVYSKNNKKLSEVVEKAEVTCLKNEERKKIQDKFEQELTKHR